MVVGELGAELLGPALGECRPGGPGQLGGPAQEGLLGARPLPEALAEQLDGVLGPARHAAVGDDEQAVAADRQLLRPTGPEQQRRGRADGHRVDAAGPAVRHVLGGLHQVERQLRGDLALEQVGQRVHHGPRAGGAGAEAAADRDRAVDDHIEVQAVGHAHGGPELGGQPVQSVGGLGGLGPGLGAGHGEGEVVRVGRGLRGVPGGGGDAQLREREGERRGSVDDRVLTQHDRLGPGPAGADRPGAAVLRQPLGCGG